MSPSSTWSRIATIAANVVVLDGISRAVAVTVFKRHATKHVSYYERVYHAPAKAVFVVGLIEVVVFGYGLGRAAATGSIKPWIPGAIMGAAIATMCNRVLFGGVVVGSFGNLALLAGLLALAVRYVKAFAPNGNAYFRVMLAELRAPFQR